jgi:hypothetical protein
LQTLRTQGVREDIVATVRRFFFADDLQRQELRQRKEVAPIRTLWLGRVDHGEQEL